jgi:hypothetical protein
VLPPKALQLYAPDIKNASTAPLHLIRPDTSRPWARLVRKVPASMMFVATLFRAT